MARLTRRCGRGGTSRWSRCSPTRPGSELPSPVAGTVLRLGAARESGSTWVEVLIELDDGSSRVVDDTEPVAPVASPQSADPAPTPSGPASRQRLPCTRRLALEAGIDLGTVTGTGPGGRITSDDLRAVGTHPAPTPPTCSSPPAHAPQGGLGQMPFGHHPLRGVRGVVARNMERSWAEIPHIHSMDEIDASLLSTPPAPEGHGQTRSLRL